MNSSSVVAVGVVCAGTAVLAATNADKWMSLCAALAFAAIVVMFAGWRNVASLRQGGGEGAKTLIESSRLNATLLSLTFGWGGLVMLGVYTLSGMWWWHSWQYGALMFAIAYSVFYYSRVLGVADHPLRALKMLDVGAVLAAMLGVGAASGLYFLISTDKLSSVKSDWPANHVFLALGVAICLLSLMAAGMHFLLRSRS